MTSSGKNNGHQKHAKLTKPDLGHFSRNEWAILGTPCGKIKQLAFALSDILSPDLKVAYVDADHKSADEEAEQGRDHRSALGHGANLEYTDKISFDRFDSDSKLNEFQYRAQFDSQDLVIVNGNHFRARKQIVVIDPKKDLEKRIDQLTDVRLILKTEDDQTIPDLLRNNVTNIDHVPIMSLNDHTGIAAHLKSMWQNNVPRIKGLVLAGGKSTRMGSDKGKIQYHGKDQRIYMLEQLRQVCDEAFISARSEQLNELENYPVITDTFLGLGPYGAILSAFQNDPNAAWLVVACDQPLLDATTLNHLVENRNVSKVATCFHNPETDFPEPLITIWEPRAYPVLLNFMSQGYSCPRKALINSDVAVVEVHDKNVLKNANTPDESKELLKLI